jgi:pyridoxine 4-dehydrogenase
MTSVNRGGPAPGGVGALGKYRVARMGFGAMQLPGPNVLGPPRDREEALAVLRRAVEMGVNHIDTAQFYGPDVSNELIQAALHPYPEDLVLVSKVGAERDTSGRWLPAQRPEQLRAGVEANLRSLDAELVHVVNLRLHQVEGDHGGGVDLDSQVAEMLALRDEGKIGAIGVSEVSIEQLHQVLTAGIVCVQNAYSLLDRSSEPLLELCQQRGVAWVPYFPLGSAFAHIPKVSEHREVIAAASALGATPAQVGLAWLLAHAPNILLIPGTSNRAHLDENLSAGAVKLDVDTKATLDQLYQNR